MQLSSEHYEAELRQDPIPLEWLEGLSHDGPLERMQGSSVDDQPAPRFEAVPSIISLLQDSNQEIRIQAAKALGRLGEHAQRVMPVIRDALRELVRSDSDASVRSYAMDALLQVGPQPASKVADLLGSLQDEIEVVRFHAAIALGELGREARPAVPALIHAALWDASPAIRVEAAVAVWKIDRKGPLVIPALIKALADSNEFICWVAADCLAQIGPEAHQAVPALKKALCRPFKMALIRNGIVLALERIDSEAAESAANTKPI